jgi:ferredoxin
MRLVVNRSTCLKTGQCYYLHPEVMRQLPDFSPEPVHERLPPELLHAARDAVELCPTSSIALEEGGTEVMEARP